MEYQDPTEYEETCEPAEAHGCRPLSKAWSILHLISMTNLALILVLGCGSAPTAAVDGPSGAEPASPDAAPPPPPTWRCDPPSAPPTPGERIVAAAERHAGKPYRWGGRDVASHPGIDCLGLLYLAVGEVTGTAWRRFPVDPSPLVQSGLLGVPVPGLDGVLREEVPRDQLQPGDVLYLLLREYEIPDAPLWTHDGARYWPWHTALYAGCGEVVHARPAAVVTRQSIDEVGFDALYVTRLPDAAEAP